MKTLSIDARIDQLISAFSQDLFDVDATKDVITYQNFIGMRATHKTAVIGTTGKKKKAYYVEGDAYTMGYLLGKLAEPDVERMCTDFNENIVFDFINLNISEPILRKILGEIVDDIINWISQSIYQDVPKQFLEELTGILDGCKEVNSSTKVSRDSLWVLNVGIDAILSYVYTGIFPHTKAYPVEMKPELFKVPIMCNGFSISGKDSSKKPYHFMGRDFMFPTADVFQDTAAMIIRKPIDREITVSVAAPGMIGTIAGVNIDGVGVGVDMSPSANCSTARPGLNSLLLTRWSIENGKTCKDAANVMIQTQRGVTWDYILADGSTDTGCIVEAGMSTAQLDFLSYIDEWALNTIKEIDPQFEQLLKNPSAPVQNGVMVRWNDYTYPTIYQSFNLALINAYKKMKSDYKYNYDPQDFLERNYLDKTWTDKYCPGPYYFAPQREKLPDLTLVTNHYVIPEMRLCAMNWWNAIVAAGNLDDIQWRYDELNNELLGLLDKGYMTYDESKATIDFLAPYRKFPDYYNKPDEHGNRKPLDQVQVHGSVSIIDLKQLTIESHYGYYSDEWIKIGLKKYVV